jgi:transposase-like protein
LPHSHYSLQVRLLAVEVYETLLSTYRRSARMFGVKAATVYHWVASLSPAVTCLAAYLGVVRTSGVIGIDDKWIQVCSPSAVRPHGRRSRAVWRYVYFAIDVYSYDLLALELYPEHSTESARLLLLELKAKGIRPRVIVTDLDPAYGRALPEVFPSAVHHECIFHALQNASAQMTQVYGRYYTCTALRLVQCGVSKTLRVPRPCHSMKPSPSSSTLKPRKPCAYVSPNSWQCAKPM